MPPKVEVTVSAEPAQEPAPASTGGCCCCRNKVAPDGPVEVNPEFWAEKRNGCHKLPQDPWFCCLLLAYWIGMVIVLLVAAGNGNGNGIESLLYGKDWQGSTCGVDNAAPDAGAAIQFAAIDLSEKPKLFFPLEGQEMPPPADLSDVTLYGICHDECPDKLGKFELECGCLRTNPPLPGWKKLQLGCEEPGADLSGAEFRRVARGPGDAAITTAEACATAGGTWDFETNTALTGKDTTAPACLTAQGVLFGTRFPTAGYAQYGASHDCVCDYTDSACWDVTYPTKEIMHHCVPCEDPTQPDCQPPVDKQTKCVDEVSGVIVAISAASCSPLGASVNYCAGDRTCCRSACVATNCPDGDDLTPFPVDGSVACPADTHKYVLSIIAEKEMPDNVIGDAVSGNMATLTQYINDLFACRLVVWVCGGLLSVVFSAIWVAFLKYCAEPLVFITVFGFLSLLAMLTVVGLSKSGQMTSTSDLLVAELSLGSSNITGFLGIPLAPSEERWIWTIVWIVSGIAFCVDLVMLCLKQKQIRQATQVIKEAGTALKDMPLMLAFPFLPFILAIIVFFYFLLGASFIWTAEGITMAQVTSDVTAAAAAATGANATIVSQSSDGEDIVFYMFWYHLFGILWANQFISAISMTTIAGAYSYWYFYGRDEDKKADVPMAFMRSLSRVFRFHIGSMAFGAMLVALVQLARAILMYLDKNTKTWQDKSVALRIAFKVIHCCLWCFEKLLKFITRNAYIFIAINGKSFCASAKHAFMTILKNLFLVGFVNLVSGLLILLGKVMIMVGCGVLTYIWVEGSGSFTYEETVANADEGVTLIKSPVVSVIFTMLLAYVCSSMFFYTYQLGVDTLLMCFIEEKTILDAATAQGREVNFKGPEGLVKFMTGWKKGESHTGKEHVEPKTHVEVAVDGQTVAQADLPGGGAVSVQ